MGEPFGVERRLLDAYGIPGKPEDLAPDSDLASEWEATWGDCWTTTIAQESSLDPTTLGPHSSPDGLLVATAPPHPYSSSQALRRALGGSRAVFL